MVPGQPFEYTFLDDRFTNMYEAESRLGDVFTAFAVLAIVIACLGLFGLAAFTAQQKTKEVGIRKVIGANVGQLVYLLWRDIGKLVLIAFIIGAPLAWYAMDNWLQGFEYRTSISVMIFVLTLSGSMLIALMTMCYQSLKTATSNPVKSLRTE